jgi:uncharacterized radical SAM protein YgiQ
MPFLPVSRDEALQRGWSELDIIFVSGDAYVDHPSFGIPLLARLLESRGFRVGIIPQPDWRTKEAFMVLGRPKLFFAVSAGAMDSMVAHYTPAKKLRRDDAYTPGNRHGARPNRATIVYTSRLKEAFKDAPVIIGGIEASLRRFAHYDYWEDRVRRSVLFDAKADLLVYGMGEQPLLEIAEGLRRGEGLSGCRMSGARPGSAIAPDLPLFPAASATFLRGKMSLPISMRLRCLPLDRTADEFAEQFRGGAETWRPLPDLQSIGNPLSQVRDG